MKERTGFVSNSSTTSFVVCGEKVDLRDVVFGTGKDYIAIESEYSVEGQSLYVLTKEHLELFPFMNGDFQIWDVAFSCYEGGKITVEAGTYKIQCMDIGHSIEFDDMPEWYGIDRDAVLDAILELRHIPGRIRDALNDGDTALLGMYERGEITGDGVLQTLWEARDDD